MYTSSYIINHVVRRILVQWRIFYMGYAIFLKDTLYMFIYLSLTAGCSLLLYWLKHIILQLMYVQYNRKKICLKKKCILYETISVIRSSTSATIVSFYNLALSLCRGARRFSMSIMPNSFFPSRSFSIGLTCRFICVRRIFIYI